MSRLFREGFEVFGSEVLLVGSRRFAEAGIHEERNEQQRDDQQGDPGDPVEGPLEAGAAPGALSGARMVPVAAGLTNFILFRVHGSSLF